MTRRAFEEFVASVPARQGPFEPFVYEDAAGGQTEVFLSNEMFHGEYIGPHLTLYIGEESGKLVGFCFDSGRLTGRR